jgi:hypothetical protein
LRCQKSSLSWKVQPAFADILGTCSGACRESLAAPREHLYVMLATLHPCSDVRPLATSLRTFSTLSAGKGSPAPEQINKYVSSWLVQLACTARSTTGDDTAGHIPNHKMQQRFVSKPHARPAMAGSCRTKSLVCTPALSPAGDSALSPSLLPGSVATATPDTHKTACAQRAQQHVSHASQPCAQRTQQHITHASQLTCEPHASLGPSQRIEYMPWLEHDMLSLMLTV